MKVVTIKKGHRFHMKGEPSDSVRILDTPKRVAFLPEIIPLVKPRLKVNVGDRVEIGSLLFEDKKDSRIQFLSPGGGRLSAINYGPRRVIRNIVIDLDEKESHRSFGVVSEADLNRMKRSELVHRMLEGGVWPFIRSFPFRTIADPDETPPSVLVSLSLDEPFSVSPHIYLEGQMSEFRQGVSALRKLCAKPDDLKIIAHYSDKEKIKPVESCVTHLVKGEYPSSDPGTVLYHTKRSSHENKSWYLTGQDLLMIGRFLETGRYPTDRMIIVGGSDASDPQHIKTRMGAPVAYLIGDQNLSEKTRLINGGLFSGQETDKENYLGFYETSIIMVPDGKEREFLALFNPGMSKPSYSRTFISSLFPSESVYNCNMHGGVRACIACNQCVKVCPVDILPQLTYKAILAGETEEALEHGLLDCVECGLCSFVCPSKIELLQTLKDAKAKYLKEQAE